MQQEGAREAGSDPASYIGSDVGSIRLEARLGVGGMGEVYLGYDPRLERRVAVKTLRRDQRMSPEVKSRFLREARLLSKLGHPAICRVHDLIETPAADFLVLEYVPGRTLREWAERGRPGRDERLRVAEKIATALAAAHREKIVHRDLKADNVMVTPEGAVKVLDFGIARSVQEPPVVLVPPPFLPEAAPAGAAGPEVPSEVRSADLLLDDTAFFPAPPGRGGEAFFTRADGYLTQQGTVMGTLGAMSPEQAGGGHVAEASDLYSFGILLQELVTGEPAYDKDGGEMEKLRRVLRAETRPVRLDPDDPDLARLIQDLQSLDPRRRPTAEEAAARLSWILDAPERHRRRRRRAAALAGAFALLVAVLAVVSWLAVEAERARREAERRRVQAEGLIGFMLGDLRPRLEAVDRLDLLDAVGDRALAYFAEVPEGQLTGAELIRRIQALQQIGEVRYSQGRLPEALAAFRRAEALAVGLAGHRLAGDRPGTRAEREAEGHLNVARAWIGQIHYDQGDLGAALRVWQSNLQWARAVLARSPGDPEWINNVALASHNVGTALERRGDLAGALAHYRENLALQRRLAARAPEDAEIQAQVANTLAFVSAALERQGDLAGALARRREFLAIQQRLAARHPEDPERQHELAVAEGYVALTLAARGGYAEARELAGRGFAIADRLAARDPGNAVRQRWLGAFQSTLGTLAAGEGDTPEALRRLGAARAIFQRLVEQDATNRDSRLQLGVCRMRTAQALERSDPAAALAQARAGAEILAPLRAEADDAVRGYLAEAAATRGRIAGGFGARGARGGRQEAAAAWQEALTLVAAASPPVGHWRLLDARAQALLGLGRAAEAQPDLARLGAMGYRSGDLEEMVRRAATPYPPP